jgi:hypothetical protein
MYGGSSFWNISIYDNNNNNVLYLTEYGITIIEYKDGFKKFHKKPYTKE